MTLPPSDTTETAAAPGALANSSGPHHRIALRPGATCTYIAFNTDVPSMTEASSGTIGNVVRFTDEERRFAEGVPGFAESLDALICWLRDGSGELPLRLVGEGAGASLALIGGFLLPRVSFLAVDPVPSLANAEDHALAHPFWGEVAALAAHHPGHQLGVTAISAWDPAGAALLSRDEFLPPAFGTVIELPCRGSGMTYLRRKHALLPLLEHGSDAVLELRNQGVVGRLSAFGTRRQFRIFHDAHVAMSGKGGSARRRAMQFVEREPGWTNPGWQHLRATLLRRENLLPEALAAAELAMASGAEAVEICVQYGRIVLEMKNGDAAPRAAKALEPFLRQRGIAELRDNLLALV
jgi:hypothetical protein